MTWRNTGHTPMSSNYSRQLQATDPYLPKKMRGKVRTKRNRIIHVLQCVLQCVASSVLQCVAGVLQVCCSVYIYM